MQQQWQQFVGDMLGKIGKGSLQDISMDEEAMMLVEWMAIKINPPISQPSTKPQLNNNPHGDGASAVHQYGGMLKSILRKYHSNNKLSMHSYDSLLNTSTLYLKSPQFASTLLEQIKSNHLETHSNKTRTQHHSTKHLQPTHLAGLQESAKLKKNGYLKWIFKHFCQQTCQKAKPTFEDLASSASAMNLNKWMVFCKEFSFTQKLGTPTLSSIFKHHTNYLPQMSYDQFANGLATIQTNLKISYQQLQKQYLKVSNQQSFRQKMNNLKIQYFGVRRNLQYENRILQDKRRQEMMKAYYKPKIHFRSHNRNKNKSALHHRNRSIKSKNNQQHHQVINLPKIIPKDTMSYRQYINSNSTYLSLFRNKKIINYSQSTQTTNKTYKDNIHNLNLSESHNYQPIRMAKSSINNHQQSKNYMQSIKQYFQIDIDSDAESDQILKKHFKNEKKTNRLIISSLLNSNPNKKLDQYHQNVLITQLQ